MNRLLPSLVMLALAQSSGRAQEAMPVQTVTRLKEATTFIRTSAESDVDGPTMSGSGFVIHSEGTTAYIITNAHVVMPEMERETFTGRPTVRVYLRSGTKDETSTAAEIVASFPERDLALLRISKVANPPGPIELTSDTEPFETMTVYIFGFPFGKQLADRKHNPPVNVGRGQVSSVRRNDGDRITSLLLDGALNPGNSGGPVVDTKGRLVGVARATIRGANIGFAIAAAEVGSMLCGKAEETSLTLDSINGSAAQLTVETRLIDPLNRIKSVRLLCTQATARFSRKQRQKPLDDPVDDERDDDSRFRRKSLPEFVYGPIERAETHPLRIDHQRALGTLPISWVGKDMQLWCQVAIVDGSGQTVLSRPSRFLLGAGQSAAGGKHGAQSLTFWGEAVDPDGDCSLKLAGGELDIAVPGTLHDLNVDIGKNNAPRVVRRVEGDFVAEVKVAGSFQPGAVRTGPRSVPFNGGGLLVWLDQRDYIRLERGAMFRGDRVLGLLLFESRERGTRSAVHNKGGLDPREDLWLRIERKGSTFSGSTSRDGREWEDLEPMDVDWPARLSVGVDGVNSCGDPMTVRFRNYELVRRKTGTDRARH